MYIPTIFNFAHSVLISSLSMIVIKRILQEKKARRRAQEKVQDDEDFHSLAVALSEDEETFRQYADVCVNEWATLGKNTKPMTNLLSRKTEELMAATVGL